MKWNKGYIVWFHLTNSLFTVHELFVDILNELISIDDAPSYQEDFNVYWFTTQKHAAREKNSGTNLESSEIVSHSRFLISVKNTHQCLHVIFAGTNQQTRSLFYVIYHTVTDISRHLLYFGFLKVELQRHFGRKLSAL